MIKYVVDGEMEFMSVSECAEYIVENGINEQEYDEMLDECYEMVNVCGYEYYPSYALKNLDSVAYYCSLNDYRSSRQEDIEYELDCMSNGDNKNICYGYEVECIEEYPSFKVKCIKNNGNEYFTIGQVYSVIDGDLLDNDNDINSPYGSSFESLEEINDTIGYCKFEIVEE